MLQHMLEALLVLHLELVLIYLNMNPSTFDLRMENVTINFDAITVHNITRTQIINGLS